MSHRTAAGTWRSKFGTCVLVYVPARLFARVLYLSEYQNVAKPAQTCSPEEYRCIYELTLLAPIMRHLTSPRRRGSSQRHTMDSDWLMQEGRYDQSPDPDDEDSDSVPHGPSRDIRPGNVVDPSLNRTAACATGSMTYVPSSSSTCSRGGSVQ
jgi:hypothetical protein